MILFAPWAYYMEREKWCTCAFTGVVRQRWSRRLALGRWRWMTSSGMRGFREPDCFGSSWKFVDGWAVESVRRGEHRRRVLEMARRFTVGYPGPLPLRVLEGGGAIRHSFCRPVSQMERWRLLKVESYSSSVES